MEKHSLETWYALADADPQGTFNKLVKSLDISFSTAEIILSDNNKNYLAACKYLIEKHKRKIEPPVENIGTYSKDKNIVFMLLISIAVFLGLLLFVYIVANSIIKNPQLLGSCGAVIFGLFLLYHTYLTGKIKPTLRAHIGIWLILFSGIYFVIDEFQNNKTDSTSTISFDTPTTTSTQIIRTMTPNTSCLKWSEISAQMEGQQVCVYGTVQSIYSTNETWTRIKFTDRPNTFFIYDIQNIYTDLNIRDCLIATSTVKVYENIPYMEVIGELLYCEPWMEQ